MLVAWVVILAVRLRTTPTLFQIGGTYFISPVDRPGPSVPIGTGEENRPSFRFRLGGGWVFSIGWRSRKRRRNAARGVYVVVRY